MVCIVEFISLNDDMKQEKRGIYCHYSLYRAFYL